MWHVNWTSKFWANFLKVFIEFVCKSLRARYFIITFNKIRREVQFRFFGIYYVFQVIPGFSDTIFSCDQAALWMVQSVCLSVHHTFLTMFPSSYHPEIFRSYYQWQKWCPCKRSRSKVNVTEVLTQLSRFQTVTPVWIHIWWWNDAQSLMLLRRGSLLFFKVIRQISRSHG